MLKDDVVPLATLKKMERTHVCSCGGRLSVPSHRVGPVCPEDTRILLKEIMVECRADQAPWHTERKTEVSIESNQGPK